VLAIGPRGADGIRFLVRRGSDEAGAPTERETTAGAEAYAGFQPGRETPYREGWLPE
jgi:hypothetical protein